MAKERAGDWDSYPEVAEEVALVRVLGFDCCSGYEYVLYGSKEYGMVRGGLETHTYVCNYIIWETLEARMGPAKSQLNSYCPKKRGDQENSNYYEPCGSLWMI